MLNFLKNKMRAVTSGFGLSSLVSLVKWGAKKIAQYFTADADESVQTQATELAGDYVNELFNLLGKAVGAIQTGNVVSGVASGLASAAQETPKVINLVQRAIALDKLNKANRPEVVASSVAPRLQP